MKSAVNWHSRNYYFMTQNRSLPEKVTRPALLMEDTLDSRGLGGVQRAGAEKFHFKLAVDEPWAVGSKVYSSQNNVSGR